MAGLNLTVTDLNGKKVGDIAVPESLFAIEPNEAALHFACEGQRFNHYKKTATTKGRSEVSGGGKKVHNQKGGGRSRQGGSRAPHRVGGGICFGPQNIKRDFKVNKKVKALAIASILSDRQAGGQIHVVRDDSAEPKTKSVTNFLKKLKLENARVGFVLFDELNLAKSARNLRKVDLLTEEKWTSNDFIKTDSLVFSEGALQKIVDRWNKAEKEQA